MTSRSSCQQAIPAEALATASVRRIEDDYEAESPKTTAGLLVGLLLCAGSSALTIWLATLLF